MLKQSNKHMNINIFEISAFVDWIDMIRMICIKMSEV